MKRAYLSFATASVAAFSLLASAANAAIFTDRASFDAAAGPTTTETFQSCPSGNPTFNGTLGAGTCAGLVTGVTFTTSQGYIAQPGQSTNPTTALGVNTPTGGIQNIALTNTATAFGADLFENFGGGSQGAATNFSINLLLNGSSIGIFTPLVQPNGGSFWGITSASAFNQIQI
ncbi:MAG: hypothetical protein JWO33_527, partial [Caulobacteraceae bacterium]|nr:hypothetical protein [Caulobacteraceae bacterium]